MYGSTYGIDRHKAVNKNLAIPTSAKLL